VVAEQKKFFALTLLVCILLVQMMAVIYFVCLKEK